MTDPDFMTSLVLLLVKYYRLSPNTTLTDPDLMASLVLLLVKYYTVDYPQHDTD